ncbi:Hsp20/alpha crystallin family protein [Inmirania thermothiophila]|uniref:HSP20 family protein n=1 Tax=Inmirania thermothiophila TaxID=1750597 RepID=A0A3N1Y6X7_9GAMM|nr:Hsp20/alpha crystallin family protein [Inmirania thermothiophila]ROR34563.1 HSP20 family protein [Inmirania thermothiophila]
MSTLQEIRHGLGRALATLSEGWHQLRERAAHALTRFTPRRGGGAVETGEEAVARMAPRWGLLAAEVSEDDAHVLVRLEAPGLEPEDFDLAVVDDILVVRGEKRVQRTAGNARYHLLECAYGLFERAIPLPAPVNEAGTEARYRNGVLSVRLPKRAAAARRRIPVEVRS